MTTPRLLFVVGLLAWHMKATAQVSSGYFFNQRASANPATLVQKKASRSVSYLSGSGSGTYQQNQLEREKRTVTASNLLYTSLASDFSYQVKLVPSSDLKIDEATQYTRVTATRKTMELGFLAAKKWNESIAYGAGLGTERVSTGSYTDAEYLIPAGATYLVGNHFAFGLLSTLHYSSAPSEQGRSWFDYGGGLSVYTDSSSGLRARLDYSTTRSPKVYQRASSDIGANYQRLWTENRYVAEIASDFYFFDLVLNAALRNRNYRALEEGYEEREAEEDFAIGAVFSNDRLGVFAGQRKQVNKINLHVTTDKSNYAAFFYSF